mmetsp:Transcript_162023/g.519483  ORF Transcript_162023/g.519483 Transcript_162023/m.519483 type:complete len:431 (+) Transcript_162023:419-1711(+)
MHEQLDLAAKLLTQARDVVEASVIEPPDEVPGNLSCACPIELSALFERMAQGIVSFRPGLAQLEKWSGEFDAFRVCREFVDPSDTSRKALCGFDVELIRWGDAKPATPQNFAEPLFPPSGRPPDSMSAAWQREVFHRICQRDASKHVVGAAWAVLHDLRRRGAEFRLQGRHVGELGLAHGIFFWDPLLEGPEPRGRASPSGSLRADALGLCSGSDKRLVMFPSFTSLGVAHTWLLLRVEIEHGVDAAKQDGAAEDERYWEEFCADLCPGSLGLLPPSPLLTRSWAAVGELRFVPRRSVWGADVVHSLAPRPSDAALIAVLSQTELPTSAEDVLGTLGLVGDREATIASAEVAASVEEDASGRMEVGRRLQRAILRLGLPCSLPEPADDGGAPLPPDDAALEATQKAAVAELMRRKLRAVGLAGVADRATL